MGAVQNLSERIHFRASPDKALESLVYLAQQSPGLPSWRLLKVIYYADKRHLELYGRSVTGDRYVAMREGPVPSLAYDLVKLSELLPEPVTEEALSALRRETNAKGWKILYAARDPKMEVFSRTDIECLQWSLQTYAPMSWEELSDRAHAEPAYLSTPLNGEMPLEEMIDHSVPDREALIEQLRETADAIEF